MKAGRVTALAALTASSLLLVACNAGPTNPEVPDLGNAEPEASPASTSPAGQVIDVASEVSDMEAAGDILGLRSGGTLTLGTLDAFGSGDTTEVTVPEACADLTASADTFVLACGDEVLLVDAASGDIDTRSVADTDAAPPPPRCSPPAASSSSDPRTTTAWWSSPTVRSRTPSPLPA